MSNLIGRGLRKPEMRYYSQNNPRQEIQQRQFIGGQLQMLSRITNAFGETARPNNGKNYDMLYLLTVSATSIKYQLVVQCMQNAIVQKKVKGSHMLSRAHG